MKLPDILLSKKELGELKFEEIISKAEKNECFTYNTIFSKKAQECNEIGDEKNAAVFGLLSAVTSFLFQPESRDEIFGPLFVFNNSRGLIPADLSTNNIESLKIILVVTHDNELIARIADVLWILTKDYKMAKQAIHAYLESAIKLEDPEHWPPAADRIERALRLSASLRDTIAVNMIIAHIEKTLKKYDGKDPLFFSSKLMGLLLEFKRGKSEEYIPLCRRVAEQALLERNWQKARIFFEIESRWHNTNSDNEKSMEALVREAEVYVKEADSGTSSKNPSYLVASTHLHKAIEAYRRIGGHQKRIEEIHKTLLNYQKNIPNEMQKVSHTLDLSKTIKESQEKVKGKSFIEAINILALSFRSPRIKELEERVKKMMVNHPIQFLVTRMGINSEGKVIVRKPSMGVDGSENNQEAIRAEMYEQANSIDILVHTRGIIEPAVRIINIEHSGNQSDFFELLRNNPFIPAGREVLFARALSAGLQGDFVTFLSIATSQVENSIRHLLFLNGIPTSKIDQDGIQKEIDLNELLFMKEVIKILGEDLAFDLQGLLILPTGSNLRNRVAHGLLDVEEFNTIHVLYFWWLILHMIVLCGIQSQKMNINKKEN